VEDRQDVIEFAIGMHQTQLTRILGRGNQLLHALREDLQEHILFDHQAGVVADIIVDHHKSDIIAEVFDNGFHDLGLMLY